MGFRKSFKLLVATGKIPFFTVVSIIFEQDCRRCKRDLLNLLDYNYDHFSTLNKFDERQTIIVFSYFKDAINLLKAGMSVSY